MFKLKKEFGTITWPVWIEAPTSGGSVERHTFTAHFKMQKYSDFEKALQGAENDAELIKSFLVGWDDLVDENGDKLEFAPEVIDELCEYPFIRQAILRAYNSAMAGAPVKN